MRRTFTSCSLAIVVLLAALKSAAAPETYPQEFTPVVQIFSGLSYADRDMIRNATTPDFLLLEIGEVWDLEFLLSLVKPSDQERRNFFSVVEVKRFQETVLISYWNRALISSVEGSKTRAWLESVLVVNTPGGWKLKHMHSTRVDPESVPADLAWSEWMIERPNAAP